MQQLTNKGIIKTFYLTHLIYLSFLLHVFTACMWFDDFIQLLLVLSVKQSMWTLHVVPLFEKMLCKIWFDGWLSALAQTSVVPQTIDYHHQPFCACVCVCLCVLIMQLLSATVRPAETPMCSLLIARTQRSPSPLGGLKSRTNRPQPGKIKDKDHITKREWQLSRTVSRVTNSLWYTGLLMCSHWVGRSWERACCTKRLYLTETMISTILSAKSNENMLHQAEDLGVLFHPSLCLLHAFDKKEKLPQNWRCKEEKVEI